MDSKQIVVIGGGPGGYVAAIRAAQLGARVTLVEKDRIGGTCLNRGCIPTKALLQDAKLLRSLKNSPVFRYEPLNPSGLLRSMVERKEKVVDELVKGIEFLLSSYRVKVIQGEAHLLNSKRVEVIKGRNEREILEADAILLAPGSVSRSIPHLSPDREKIITSDEALELREVPQEMVIVGGGYIGVELATFFHTLGSKVTIVEILDNILPGIEEEVVRNLRRIFEKEGIQIFTNSSVEEVRKEGTGLELKIDTPKGKMGLSCEKVLLAVGRTPNITSDLTQAGIENTPEGIKVNSYLETTLPNVYAIGDAIGETMLAPIAMAQGVLASENVMGFKRQWKKPLIPLCIFSYPEIASVGLTEKEAKERGPIKIGRFPFRSNPKAILSAEPEGWIKVIASQKEDTILGIHILGPDANILASVALTMIGGKLGEFTRFIQAHPTLPEALREACLDVDGLAIHLPKPFRGRP